MTLPKPRKLDSTDLDSLDCERWRTADEDVTFYVCSRSTAPAPLLLCIQGSGCDSVIRRRADGSCGFGLPGFVQDLAAPSWRVMAVEKPGVPCGYRSRHPGSAVGCPEAFVDQYRFDRWLDVLGKAVRAALEIPGVRRTPLAVIGESEGSLMAAHLAARIGEVSHVALLSPTAGPQFSEFAEEAGRPEDDRSDVETHRDIEELFEQFRRILADPTSTDDRWRGHPFQRWATFATQSTLDGLRHSDARALLVYGSRDASSGADRLRAALVASGHDVTARRLPGADHRLTVETPGAERDIRDALQDVVDWLGTLRS